MTRDLSSSPLNPETQAVELGHLLTQTVSAVIEAQERLDNHSLRRKREYEEAPEGSLALPPLWYAFEHVAVELELSVSVAAATSTSTENGKGDGQPALFGRLLNPNMVALFGHQASSGFRIRAQLGPGGNMPIKMEQTDI